MATVICAACGQANGKGARFCEACGTALAPRCPGCGAEVSPTMRFEVDEILAREDWKVCLRGAFRNEQVGSIGPSEMPLGYVATIKDGLVGSLEIYESDDVDTILARFAEL